MTSIDRSQSTVDKLTKYVDSHTTAKNGVDFSRDEVKALFADFEYYNDSDWDGDNNNKNIETLNSQIAKLEEKIAKFQEKADEIQKQIDDLEVDVTKKSEELVKIVANIGIEQTEYQEKVHKAAEEAKEEALEKYKAEYERNPEGANFETIFKDIYDSKIGGLKGMGNIISALSYMYDQKEGEITAVCKGIETCVQQVKTFTLELDNTTATINLLTRTKSNMASTMEGAYKNEDETSDVPVFSGRKADVANSLLEKYSSRYDTKSPSAEERRAQEAQKAQEAKEAEAKEKATKQQTTKEKWTGLKEGTFDKGTQDVYNKTSNPELKNLGDLIEQGMLQDLQDTGMDPDEIIDFVQSNWATGIRKSKDGNAWSIPYGHGTTGHMETNQKYLKDADGTSKIYDALRGVYDNNNNKDAAATEDKKVDENATAENTANLAQVQELKTAVETDGILETMYKEGFTFKEAMYTLSKIFPDAGFEYDLSAQPTGDNPNEQAPANDTRNYKKVTDSESTGKLYETMGDKILKYWNVGAGKIDPPEPPKPDPKPDPTPPDPTPPEKHDPIVFQQGTTTWTFVEDRNNDGKFDYKTGDDNDLLGSKDGINELLKYDYNGDGKIDSNDVYKDEKGNTVEMTVLNADGTKSTRSRTALDMLQLMSNKQTESVANSSDIDDYKDGDSKNDKSDNWTNTVDFGIGYTSATELGITEIDLTSLKGKDLGGKGEQRFDTDKAYDEHQEEYEDINGSAVIAQFNIKTDGSRLDKAISVKETLNTNENLNIFYNQVAQSEQTNSNKIVSRLSMEDTEQAFIYQDGKLKENFSDLILDDKIKGDVIELTQKIDTMWKTLEEKVAEDGSIDLNGFDPDHINLQELHDIKAQLDDSYYITCRDEEDPIPDSDPVIDEPERDKETETEPETEPEPTTEPDPTPDPTPEVEPEPDPTPDPTPAPTPEVDPEPEYDPERDLDPNKPKHSPRR